MSTQFPVPSPPKNRLMVYVDGFNRYHGLHDTSGHKHLWLDLPKLAHVLRPNDRLEKLKYFTAPVLNDAPAQARQARYIDALESLHGGLVEVVHGRYQAKQVTCRHCGHTRTVYEEKETDVNLATAIAIDAVSDNFDSAMIILADSDVAPAVRAAKSTTNSLFIVAAFPPGRFSKELKSLMPASFQIYLNKINKSLLPDSFAARGKSFTRPAKWY